MWSPTTPPPDAGAKGGAGGNTLNLPPPGAFEHPRASTPAGGAPAAPPPAAAAPTDDRGRRIQAPTFVSSATRPTPTMHAVPPHLAQQAQQTMGGLAPSSKFPPGASERPTPQAPSPVAPPTVSAMPAVTTTALTTNRSTSKPPSATVAGIPPSISRALVEFEDDVRNESPKVPRATAVGRSISGSSTTSSLPDPVEDRAYKGTLHGHSLHLPMDLPEPPDEVKPATVLQEPTSTTAGQLVAMIPDADFTGRDTGGMGAGGPGGTGGLRDAGTLKPGGLFREPGTTAYQSYHASPVDRPPSRTNIRKRGRYVASATIFVAVVASFVIVAALWARLHRNDVALQPSTVPTELAPAAPGTAPSPGAPTEAADPNAPAPSAGAAAVPREGDKTKGAADETARPAGAPDVEAASARAATPPAPRPAAIDPYAERPGRADQLTHAEGKLPERVHSGTRRHSSTAEPPPPHSVRPPGSSSPAPKPSHAPKRPEDDPDGTLPPTD
jgi:hypothetical protein